MRYVRHKGSCSRCKSHSTTEKRISLTDNRFIQSDPWWSLAMAINCVKIFFFNGNSQSIKKWGWLYCLICYGGPCIIAFSVLSLKDPDKTKVYGNAGLWCWITNDWNRYRIYTYYMLIWFCIVSSMIIYIAIGVYVFRARNRLQQFNHCIFGLKHTSNGSTVTGGQSSQSGESKDIQGSVSIVTEVSITHSTTKSTFEPIYRPITRLDRAFTRSHRNSNPWSVLPQNHHRASPSHATTRTVVTSLPTRPSTSTGTSSNPRQQHHLLDRFRVLDPVKRAYLRTSFLFALSVLVTWIPSSINRIHGLIYNDSPYAYNVGTATVLPLQGVWNAVIFFVTSWKVLRECVDDWRRKRGVVRLVEVGRGERKGGEDGLGMGEFGEVVGLWARDGEGVRRSEGEERAKSEGEQSGMTRSGGADVESWDSAGFGREREGSDVELRVGDRQGRSM